MELDLLPEVVSLVDQLEDCLVQGLLGVGVLLLALAALVWLSRGAGLAIQDLDKSS